MRMLELSDGVFINLGDIEAVRKPDLSEGKTIIFTHHRKYRSSMPFETIMGILGNEELTDRTVNRDDAAKETMSKLEGVLKNVGHFAG